MPNELEMLGPLGNGTNALRAYEPTMREKLSYWLNQTFFGDDREGQEKANKVLSLLDFTPFGALDAAYNVGRQGAEGNWFGAGMNLAMAGLPIKGFRAGHPRSKYDSTFYATERRGAEPYASPEFPIQEHELRPEKMLDTHNPEHRQIYEQFMAETGHPARYGSSSRPFWTAERDLWEWLDAKGYDFDAVMFDENTNVPSIAVRNKK